MSLLEIGCCGAVCKTCPPYKENICRGCEIGYKTGVRALTKAKCAIKQCCMTKGLAMCGDCDEFLSCNMIQDFYRKNGYKYKKYKESMDFIREHGYDDFLQKITTWKRAYGKL